MLGKVSILITVFALLGPSAHAADWKSGDVLVKFRDAEPGTALAQVRSATKLPLSRVRPLAFGWTLLRLAGDKPISASEAVARLKGHPLVAAAAQNRIYQASAQPDDDELEDQWALQMLEAEAAWDVTQGRAEVRLGILDSGLNREHRDIEARDTFGFDFITSEENAVDGDGRDADYEDDFGSNEDCGEQQFDGIAHGTRVAAVAGASTNNGRDVAGVDWEAGIVSARVLGPCGAELADVFDAAGWLAGESVPDTPAIETNQADVILMSLGAPGACNPAEEDLMRNLLLRGIIVVAAAGNGAGAVETPANCPSVVGVGAVNRSGTKAAYSNFGAELSIFAPGGDVSNQDEDGVRTLGGPGNTIRVFAEGTSIAAGYVAGALTLAMAANPTLEAAQLIGLLSSTGVPCADCGGPLLNLRSMVEAAAATPPPADKGEACSPSQSCKTGLLCSAFGGAMTCKQACDFATGLECDAFQHCLAAPEGGLCLDAGTTEDGGACSQTLDCAFGNVCVQAAGAAQQRCERQCHHGWECRGTTEECIQVGDGTAYCVTTETKPMPPEEMVPSEDPQLPTGCRISLGNLDCADGMGCLDDGTGDELGYCGGRWDGTLALGEMCTDRFACASGICSRGVCLAQCSSGGCTGGYTCDVSEVEVGICRPEDCFGSSIICAAAMSCEQTTATDEVCAIAPAGCSDTRTNSTPVRAALTLLIFMAGTLLRARRRRSRPRL